MGHVHIRVRASPSCLWLGPVDWLVHPPNPRLTPPPKTGKIPIHDLHPESVHQRVPTFLGSPTDVDNLMKCVIVAP